jgi:hypothetical protein
VGRLHFEIVVKDETFRKIDDWKFDSKDSGKMFRAMNYKYGLGLKIKDVERVDSDDIDWLR